MEDYLKSYKFTIETLTPVHIGSGELLDKLEYVVERDEFKIIDYQFLLAIPSICSAFSAKFSSIMSKNSGTVIRDFNGYLSEVVRLHPRCVKQKFQITAGARKALGSTNAFGKHAVWMMPKSGETYYVPGSSIKGAIRTALIYSWMDSERRTDLTAQVGKLRDEINRLSNEPISHRDARGIYKKNLEPLSDKVLEEYSCFRNNGPNYFRGLRVSDISLQLDDLYIELVLRKHIKTVPNEQGIPNYAQLLKAGRIAAGHISILSGNERIDVAQIHSACNTLYKPIFKSCGLSTGAFETDLRTKFILPLGKFMGALTKTFEGMRAVNVMPIPKRKSVPYKLEQKPKTCNELSEDGCLLGWVLCTLEE